MKKIFSIALLAAVMSSCGVLKNYERPAEISTDGIYGDAISGDTLGLGDVQWRKIFTDPTLQALIDKALTQNTNIKNTGLQLLEMQYALKASKMAFLPTLDFNPQGNVSKIFDPYNRASYSAMTENYNKAYGLGMTFGWINNNFLQLINAKKGAHITVQQLENAKRAVQCALVANVATLYYTLAQMDEQLSLMKQTQANWGEYLSQEKKLMEAGQANIAAVANIEATYYSISQSVVTLESNIRILENNFCTLLGETGSHINRGALTTFQIPEIITTGAPISILSRRPDVRSAELTLAKAFYSVNEAKASFYPSLTLSATGSFTNSGGGGIINPGLVVTNFLASLSQPIYKSGRLKATLYVKQKEMEIAQNNFQQAIISAGNEVNTAMLEVRDAEEQRELINKQVNALETAYDATKKLYAMSSMNYLNVITAHNSLLQAHMTQISNRMDAINATIEMYQALGGGAD